MYIVEECQMYIVEECQMYAVGSKAHTDLLDSRTLRVQQRSVRCIQQKSFRCIQQKSVRCIKQRSVRCIQQRSVRCIQQRSVRYLQYCRGVSDVYSRGVSDEYSRRGSGYIVEECQMYSIQQRSVRCMPWAARRTLTSQTPAPSRYSRGVSDVCRGQQGPH